MNKISEAITVNVEMTHNPYCYNFVLNKLLLENEYKIFYRNSKNIEESKLVVDLLEMYSEINEIFLKSNFISISFGMQFEITENYLESIRNKVFDYFENSLDILNKDFADEIFKIQKCIDEYINPSYEMEGGLLKINNYSKKHNLLILQTIGYCRNHPSILIDLDQVKKIVNKVCNLNIKNIVPIVI